MKHASQYVAEVEAGTSGGRVSLSKIAARCLSDFQSSKIEPSIASGSLKHSYMHSCHASHKN
jgi:hypothetical protein